MSVTLKLADQDAQLIGNILLSVGKLQKAASEEKETRFALAELDRLCSSASMITRVAELAGSFQTAVRANQR